MQQSSLPGVAYLCFLVVIIIVLAILQRIFFRIMFTQMCRIQYFKNSCPIGQINTVQPCVHHCSDAPTIMYLVPINLVVGYDRRFSMMQQL